MAPRLKFPRLIIAFVMELYLYSCTDTYSGILGAIKNVVYTACTGMELGMVFGGMMAHSRAQDTGHRTLREFQLCYIGGDYCINSHPKSSYF